MLLFFRVLILLLIIAVIATVAAWMTETPGTITLVWRDWRIDTSVAVILVLIAVLIAICAVVYQIWRWIRRMPGSVRGRREGRLREQGYLALTRGMVAIAAGDSEEAKRQAKRANEILDRPPGALLIGAQAAQMEKKPGVARKFYDAMIEKPETELLGLRGLITLADQSGDDEAALGLAERARKLSPDAPWLLSRLFQLQLRNHKWEEAEETARAAIDFQTLKPEDGKRQDATLLIQLSLMAEQEGDRVLATDRARKALKIDPDLSPAAAQLAHLLITDGKQRQAKRLIEEVWSRGPHPVLGAQYLQLADEGGKLKRVKAAETLARLAPEHRESHILVARAALDAGLWGQARKYLNDGADTADGKLPDAGFCRLFAELEQAENGDAAAARDWLAKVAEAPREPAWLCNDCGAIVQDWAALCGHCSTFDSLRWTSPPRVMALAKNDPKKADDDPTETTDTTATEPDPTAASGEEGKENKGPLSLNAPGSAPQQ
jgi:HemY protein